MMDWQQFERKNPVPRTLFLQISLQKNILNQLHDINKYLSDTQPEYTKT